MEPKFRLSPRIDVLLSQRLEDKNRDRLRKEAEAVQREKDKENSIKIGPPARKSEVVKKVTFVDEDLEGSRTTERTKGSFLKGKSLPYVDVPPLKATLRTSKPDQSKEDQNVKFGSYKSRAPVEIGLDIEKLVETVLDLEINIPLRSLAGVSNAVQKEIKKQVTKTKWPVETEAKVNLLEEKEKEESLVRVETLPAASYMVMTEVSEEIPEGHLVASDPVVQFLMENKDAEPGNLIVAKRSEPLRAIYTTVNRVGQEECLLDEGSMIVSMAKNVAMQLGLTWDPSIRINMESASKHVEETLGLARNVCFAVGGLNLYLQVHILENPPYRILLGRPFGTLTSSTVHTKMDGSSEIILTDPNTKAVVIVPTYERGVGPEELQKQRYQAF